MATAACYGVFGFSYESVCVGVSFYCPGQECSNERQTLSGAQGREVEIVITATLALLVIGSSMRGEAVYKLCDCLHCAVALFCLEHVLVC